MDEKNQNQENLEEIKEPAGGDTSPAGPQPGPETSPEREEKPKPQPDAGKSPGKAGQLFKGNKFKRGGMATVMTIVFIAIVVVMNLLVSLLTDRFPSMNVDLTAQRMNTLSDQAMEVAAKVDQETTIYLIGEEDAYRSDLIYSSYGLKYSQVANLAERLEEANGHIHTKFVDPDTNPEFVSSYSDEMITTGRVLVETEKRHRLLTVDDLFAMKQNQTTGVSEMYSTVDSALASALEMVNMDKVPVLTIATGHSEMMAASGMTSFVKMMEDQNFEVQEIDLLTEEIPEQTQLLMLPTPTTDYTDDELAKLRDLLADSERRESVAILVTFHPNQTQLPKLSSFLEEWGVTVKTGTVVAESDSSRYVSANPSFTMVDSVSTALEKKTYDRIISPMSVPLELAFSGNGEVSTGVLLSTADSAYLVTESTSQEEVENPDTAKQAVATLSTALTQFDNDFYFRSVMVFGSSYMFTDSFLETAFDNRTFLSDLLKYATDTDGSEVTVYTERVQTNVMDITASQNTIVVLGLGIFTIGLPVLILAAGLVIFLKRRHL